MFTRDARPSSVWFVTGASQGLGLSLVTTLLAAGHRVAATSRSEARLIEAVGGPTERFLALEVDLTDDGAVGRAVAGVVERFGRLDVAVNNAGYAQAGTLEEVSDAEARRNYDVNVFGVLNVVRHVAARMRAQGSGHIVNIASVGGFVGDFPVFGIYCSTKFAVVGLTEALAAEMRPHGVAATVVCPGYFRTNFLATTSLRTPAHRIDAYANARELERAHLEDINGQQAGDPDRAAEIIVELAGMSEPPVHLFLGADAYQFAGAKLTALHESLDAHETLATSTAFAQV